MAEGKPNALPDAPSTFHLAAAGDREAQCVIFQEIMALPAQGVCSYFEASAAGEIVARLVAAHGRPADRMALAGLLLIRARDMGSDTCRRASFAAEAMLMLDKLADEGVEEAALTLQPLMDQADEQTRAVMAEWGEGVL